MPYQQAIHRDSGLSRKAELEERVAFGRRAELPCSFERKRVPATMQLAGEVRNVPLEGPFLGQEQIINHHRMR